MENEERFTAISCLFMWLSLIGLYVMSGIVTYSIMRPQGFAQVFLWIIAWQIVASIIDILFTVFVMWLADNIFHNERT